MRLLLCKKDSFPINFVWLILQKKKNRFAVEKGIDGKQTGLTQVLGNISGGIGGPFFFFYKQNFKAIILWVLG